MNKSLNYVTGEYVLFLNAGDYLYSENTLNHFAQKIAETNYPDIINGNTVVYTDLGIEKIPSISVVKSPSNCLEP